MSMGREYKGKLKHMNGDILNVTVVDEPDKMEIKFFDSVGNWTLGTVSLKCCSPLILQNDPEFYSLKNVVYISNGHGLLGILTIRGSKGGALVSHYKDIMYEREKRSRFDRLREVVGDRANNYNVMAVDVDAIIEQELRYREEFEAE